MTLTWHPLALIFLLVALVCHLLAALAVRPASNWQAWAWAWTTAAALCLLV